MIADEEKMKDLIIQAIQAGKSETSGIVSMISRQLKSIEKEQHKNIVKAIHVYEKQNRQYLTAVLLMVIFSLVIMFIISAFYVMTTQVKQHDLDKAVATAMENYLEIDYEI